MFVKRLFIETKTFTKEVSKYLTHDEYMDFQKQFLQNPKIGKVIPGTGGLRKVRISVSAYKKGKRGGARIIYLDVKDVEWTLLIRIYGKNVKDDLSFDEKKILKQMVDEFKRCAKEKLRGSLS